MRMLHATVLSLCLAATAEAQSYGGVVPGSDVLPDNIPAAPGEAALVTWPGFQMVPSGGSRVFVQTTIEVTPELKRDGDNWQVILHGLALPAGNARRPLDTQYFNTPVRSVRTAARGNTVVLTLHMRAKLQPIMRTERVQSGYYFTYLEFPAGNFI
jgi:hypothetical protein